MGITQIGNSMFTAINSNYSNNIDDPIKKPWNAMTTTEKFIHIITVGIWSPSVPEEAKRRFNGLLDSVAKQMLSQYGQQAPAEAEAEAEIEASFYDITVSYKNGRSIVMVNS